VKGSALSILFCTLVISSITLGWLVREEPTVTPGMTRPEAVARMGRPDFIETREDGTVRYVWVQDKLATRSRAFAVDFINGKARAAPAETHEFDLP
jgi:hypothetical protein